LGEHWSLSHVTVTAAKKADKTWPQFDSDCNDECTVDHGEAATRRSFDIPLKLYEACVMHLHYGITQCVNVLVSPGLIPPDTSPVCCDHDAPPSVAPMVHAMRLIDELRRQYFMWSS
jgi:hypothetical protein